MAYSFRLHLELDTPGRIRVDGTEGTLSTENGHTVRLKTDRDVLFTEATDIAVVGSGYITEAEAHEDGERWQSAVMLGMAHNCLSAALRLRDSDGGFSDGGLDLARNALSPDSPAQIYNELSGVRTFPTEPPALFFSAHARGVASTDPERLFSSIRQAHAVGAVATPEQLLAFEMYNASFGTDAPDVKLVCLTMAVEILIEQERRSEAEQAIVNDAIARAGELDLDRAARESFVGSLRHLRDESIAAAGCRLARTLGELTYMGESPEVFFKRCYAMRSVLVHGGSNRPTKSEVGSRAATLIIFVGDLLSVPTLGALPSRLPQAQ